MIVLGFDTSNYTTSIAAYDGGRGHNCSRLLDVRPGELGLRQSDALFSHMKRLPALAAQLMDEIGACDDVVALGVSTRPRAVEGSYMPCFLAGESQARVLASVLNVPVYSFSHQQGHIAAACWGAERMDLLKTPHLAWHLSGGTTELLAGSDSADLFRVRVDGAQFSLSGVQNKLREFFEKTGDPAATARYCLRSIIHAVRKATKQALDEHPGLPVVFSGGVASNSMLREAFAGLDAVFCPPAYSTDNAMGIAVLTWEAYHGA